MSSKRSVAIGRRVDCHHSFLSENQGDDLQEAAGAVRSDEQLRGIGVRLEVIDDDRVPAGVEHVGVSNALSAR